ncbi:MAG: L,D-transpeptidase [Deltaproteobacteria bacterium]|nr:L,D-transpeptidase [Deltaproteobacteria bacterium]
MTRFMEASYSIHTFLAIAGPSLLDPGRNPVAGPRFLFVSSALLALAGAVSCRDRAPVKREPAPAAGPAATRPAAAEAKKGAGKPPSALTLRLKAAGVSGLDEAPLPEAPAGLPPERRALQVVNGQDRVVDAEVAKSRGLTIVDLSDGFAPYIFWDGKATDGAPLPNRYRAVFVGLANDRTDGDGDPLPPGGRNYLELYGIPPSLSVLRKRFLEDAGRACEGTVDNQKLLAVDGIETWGRTTEKKELANHAYRGQRLEAARKKLGAASLQELAEKDPRYQGEVKRHLRITDERAAFAEVEKRLVCEGLLDPSKHKEGSYDMPMRNAALDFQQKNAVFAQADLTRATLEAMTRPLLENDFLALRRVLAERAAHGGRIIEDGSAIEAMPKARKNRPRKVPTYKNRDGAAVPVPDLVGQATDALMARLGLWSAQDALAFFRRHGESDFRSMRAAVRFPPLPEYYGPHMDLVAEIDRGDVWYAFPFDEKGQRLPQYRDRFPKLTLFVNWRGEKVPLLCWRTTIGGWRTEFASDGQEYYRYKGSEVGFRVWRHVVAAPVWLPPTAASLSSMTKVKYVAGAYPKVTNYDETGPGYLSAYGLVAGIHEHLRRRGDGLGYYDNGIRTHGSFDYLSIRNRFSHGCHRLYNNLAVRLFSFVLTHRKAKALGQIALGFRRTFYWEGEVYDMRLPTRGFYFQLDPPLSVRTLKGRIRGQTRQPILEYVQKPGVDYGQTTPPPVSGDPESKAGGGP